MNVHDEVCLKTMIVLISDLVLKTRKLWYILTYVSTRRCDREYSRSKLHYHIGI